jgi:hypothetical protein
MPSRNLTRRLEQLEAELAPLSYAAVVFRPPRHEVAGPAVTPFSLHHFCQLSSRIR